MFITLIVVIIVNIVMVGITVQCSYILTDQQFQCRYLDAFLAYAGANMCLAAAAAALCAFIAPAAAGSGIPEVKAYLNGVDAQNILAPSTLFVKVNNTTMLGASLPFWHKHG